MYSAGSMNMSEKAQIWRNLAQKSRLAARDLRDGSLRLQMLLIAARYEAIAQRAEAGAVGGRREKEREAA